jgi:hypothetical protein
MAGATIATWVKVRTKTGLTSRPISHKYEGGANYAPGQTITQSEYDTIKANRGEKVSTMKEVKNKPSDPPFLNRKQRSIDKEDISGDPVLAKLEKATLRGSEIYKQKYNAMRDDLMSKGVSAYEIENHPKIQKLEARYVYATDKNQVEQIKRMTTATGKIARWQIKDLQGYLDKYRGSPHMERNEPRIKKLTKEIQTLLSYSEKK